MPVNRKSTNVTLSDDSPVITVEDMSVFLRLDADSSNNALIATYIESGTEAVKQYTNRAIKTETFKYTADSFVDYAGDDRVAALGAGVHTMSMNYLLGGTDRLDMPWTPLQSVTSVTSYDVSNSSSVYSSDNYTVGLIDGRIYLDEGASWPSSLRDTNAVEIIYIAGYGSGSVPTPIVEAIRGYVMRVYEGCDGMSDEFRRLLAPYRIMDQLAW